MSIQTNCIDTVENDTRNMKRLFVVSDIHGHYTLMKKALDDAGFDENNDNHVFVSCGDLFDRGVENRKVYDFVRRLKRKVLICGNHDERLLTIMSEKRVKFLICTMVLILPSRSSLELIVSGLMGRSHFPRMARWREFCGDLSALCWIFTKRNTMFSYTVGFR